MKQFSPKIHHVGRSRLRRTPAAGRILHAEMLGELELAWFETEDKQTEWRVLEPIIPIAVDRIEITRAEGPAPPCGRPVICRREKRPGTGIEGSIFCDDWECSAFLIAQSQFMIWGRTAPRNGGYDKCDFKVYWVDGHSYQGRFDLAWGGYGDGELFHDSFLSRLRFYAGLSPTPSHFHRKNAIEQYTDEEARAIYLRIVSPMMEGARAILAKYEV